MPLPTVHDIFRMPFLLEKLILAATRTALAGSAIAKLYHRGYMQIEPLPTERGPNPKTNADDDVTCVTLENASREIGEVVNEVGCNIICYAEESHNSQGQRRLPMRELSHGAFKTLARTPEAFFQADPYTLQILLDGIDGDRNLLAGNPNFCVALCILAENLPRIAIIVHPTLTEDVYVACLPGPISNPTIGATATRNGVDLIPQAIAFQQKQRAKLQQLQAECQPKQNILNDVFISAHLTHSNLEIYDSFRPYFDWFHHNTKGVQLGYCGTLGLIGTGLGHYGCYVNPYVSSWDALPGGVFLRALGGVVTDITGNSIDCTSAKRVSIVASLERAIHKEVISILN